MLAAEVIRLSVCFLLLASCLCVRAQDQERSLENRIMKPDMSLENPSQNKKFTADRTSVNKKARVSAFYIQQKSPAKTFGGARGFSAGEFASQPYTQQKQATAASLSSQHAGTRQYHDGSKQTFVRQAYHNDQTQSPRDYAGSRPYLEQGKSQKSLNRKNRPMTIDEVRELLNKNK
jgi:hypothetical protein